MSVHNPASFNPADYEVVDYCDNRPPEFSGSWGLLGDDYRRAVDAYQREREQWERDLARLFGDNWRAKIHHCAHCGNGNVRWITAVHHAPTGETVVFGCDCTQRLGFTDRHAFKLARLQRLADSRAAALKVHAQVQRFADAHPEIAAARAALDLPVHAGNTFARDVIQKLARYGSISDRQVSALVDSLARDVARANRPAEVKIPAPTGKGITVCGEVISLKWQENQYGDSLKVTIKVTTPAGIWLAWGSVPAALTSGLSRGQMLELTANLEHGNDPSFAFFKRPRLARVVA